MFGGRTCIPYVPQAAGFGRKLIGAVEGVSAFRSFREKQPAAFGRGAEAGVETPVICSPSIPNPTSGAPSSQQRNRAPGRRTLTDRPTDRQSGRDCAEAGISPQEGKAIPIKERLNGSTLWEA